MELFPTLTAAAVGINTVFGVPVLLAVVAVLPTGVTGAMEIAPDTPSEEFPVNPGICGNGTSKPGITRFDPLGIAMLMERSTKIPCAKISSISASVKGTGSAHAPTEQTPKKATMMIATATVFGVSIWMVMLIFS
jgi:hypothetical protein